MYILFWYAHFELTVGYKYFTVASDTIDVKSLIRVTLLLAVKIS
jgi:hypothetical protein